MEVSESPPFPVGIFHPCSSVFRWLADRNQFKKPMFLPFSPHGEPAEYLATKDSPEKLLKGKRKGKSKVNDSLCYYLGILRCDMTDGDIEDVLNVNNVLVIDELLSSIGYTLRKHVAEHLWEKKIHNTFHESLWSEVDGIVEAIEKAFDDHTRIYETHPEVDVCFVLDSKPPVLDDNTLKGDERRDRVEKWAKKNDKKLGALFQQEITVRFFSGFLGGIFVNSRFCVLVAVLASLL